MSDFALHYTSHSCPTLTRACGAVAVVTSLAEVLYNGVGFLILPDEHDRPLAVDGLWVKNAVHAVNNLQLGFASLVNGINPE